ncbi:MAG: UDP-N-acetylmuramoyl-L-alanyl-D-glutamate--2,6-diaminopimelate ligase [Candidatus Omnitrophica bacterium]|nr:UDP-N-acetylmuramoyl-L-alanyl-D-glutamate--2,6-diaminopimelate ligase [Candidatus Omnitrophota bacterium]
MQLSEIIKGVTPLKIKGPRAIDIKGITSDSRAVKKGYMFAAIKGNNLDGSRFIRDAVTKGAVCIVSEDAIEGGRASLIEVKDVRSAYAKLCANFFKHPSQKIKVIGITGTNGKTTTAFLIQAILKKCGYKCGRITTIDYAAGRKRLDALNTTPDAVLLQEMLKDMADEKFDYCVMEASSHALHQKRTDSVKFHSAVFTNLSREHLDYHAGMDEYFLCKKKLFDQLTKKDNAIVNLDDEYGRKLLSGIKSNVISYGFGKEAKVRAENAESTAGGSSLLLVTPKGSMNISTSLIGRHNIYNILAAVSAALPEKINMNVVKKAIDEFKAPAGRLQAINTADAGISVYVDYAHTDDALEKVLSSLSALKRKRIITVFGCGGDRDKTKRPRMGKVAVRFSDFVIITSDNPRSEDEYEIISQIEKGIPKDFKNYLIMIDRKEAIDKAIQMAKDGDIILIAGKGHETYQIFKDRKVHFNDKEVASSALREKRKCLL